MVVSNNMNIQDTSDYPLTIPQFWNTQLRQDIRTRTFWDKFQGKEGSNMPIIIDSDQSKEGHDTMKISVMSDIENDGVEGHAIMEGNEGEFKEAQFTLTLEWYRQAVATDKKTKLATFWKFSQVAKQKLQRWTGTWKDWKAFNALLVESNANTYYSNGTNVTARNQLDSSARFGVSDLDIGKMILQRQGAMRIDHTVDNGKAIIEKFGCVISEVDGFNLRTDPAWRAHNQSAGVRGDLNKICTGAIGEWNGILVYEHIGISGAGIISGSPLRPEALLYGTHTNVVEILTLGEDTSKNYTRHFPAFPTASDVLSIVKADGTVEFCTYTAKTNNTFTGVTRNTGFGSLDDGGAAGTYVGNEKVTLGNRLSRQIFFGAEIMIRGEGVLPTGTTNLRDYKFRNGIGMEMAFAQKAVEDSRGNVPNYYINESFSDLPNQSI